MDEFDLIGNVVFCAVVAMVAFWLAYLVRSHILRALMAGVGAACVMALVYVAVISLLP